MKKRKNKIAPELLVLYIKSLILSKMSGELDDLQKMTLDYITTDSKKISRELKKRYYLIIKPEIILIDKKLSSKTYDSKP